MRSAFTTIANGRCETLASRSRTCRRKTCDRAAGDRGLQPGGFEAALEDVAPDATVDWSHSRGPDAGVYVRHDAIRRFWTDMTEPFERQTTVPEEFIPHVLAWYRGLQESRGGDLRIERIVDLGDRRLVRFHWHALGSHSGIETDLRASGIATFRDGRVILSEFFLDHQEALKAVGLEE